MKFYVKLFFLFSIFLQSMEAFPNPLYKGYWAIKCGGFGGGIIIKPSGEVQVNVNENNLFVSASLRDATKEHYYLLYHDVIESVNNVISWGDVSKNKPIAEFYFKNKFMYLKWNGFYNVKKNVYTWRVEPDFVIVSGGNSLIKMQKCDFIARQ
ncbi:hypothetical protein DOX53_16590 [Cronobacter malonaticus]|uniref:hypothetical protein n=1 Tax=Cronobacter malonaticus TaxID=413503 RepID=UPI000CFDB52C|nr:hypothetical protein [Cronobacter malonaticus]EGT4281625.1 hypothetical protein [Cronobacter malonaticus]EGT4290568.1 hypothetical protein [Cronobacter malonaticus]EGT4298621.1 hypothetical protein [Cronobacter malonaticus]EGT4312513.1 hypothetical protein [Cronobacter malonaticus]EGT4335731.1 hypothetical protein [Cronobacter malonaticus]